MFSKNSYRLYNFLLSHKYILLVILSAVIIFLPILSGQNIILNKDRFLEVISNIENLNDIKEFRENQIVGREIFVLKKHFM